MSRIPLVRRVVVLLLVLAVTAPLMAAPIHRPDPISVDSLGSLWTWLSHVWAKNGCMIDPHGNCLPGTGSVPNSPAGTVNGCGIDPHGACQPAPSPLPATNNGCGIDPSGRCKS